jgi:hypothetical protein
MTKTSGRKEENTVLRKIVKANFITFRTEKLPGLLDCSQVNFAGWFILSPNVILETSQERDRWYVYCHN